MSTEPCGYYDGEPVYCITHWAAATETPIEDVERMLRRDHPAAIELRTEGRFLRSLDHPRPGRTRCPHYHFYPEEAFVVAEDRMGVR